MTSGEGPARLAAAADAIVERAWARDRPTLVGVGWATVELDRAEVEVSAALGLGPGDWRDAPRDGLLGAAARIARPEGGGLVVVLLEPDTEGRLAATLARSGEGVAVAYVVAHGVGRDDRVVLSRPAETPLGRGRLVVVGRAWGPHLVALDAADPPPAPRTVRATRGGTIAP